MADRPPPRPIKRLLVCNRGEIASRVLATARELEVETYGVYTADDSSHVVGAAHAIQLPSPAAYVDIAHVVGLVREHGIDAIHPGYGFLSESPEFARRLWQEAGAVVVGPGWHILDKTGDKLKARALAEECGVPVAPALGTPTASIADLRAFAATTGYPVMIKAVDGGGGRGIRLVRSADELEGAARRAIEESPSKRVFAEKAAVDGFRHVEVQIVGDGVGGVQHLWERECSIQRRYQKVVEVAPSTIADRELVGYVIDAAVRMAEKVCYFSLGTFEFLVNPSTREYYFLEVNPRLQVEHTVTEAICANAIDLVRVQLLLAQGASLLDAGLDPALLPALGQRSPPRLHSIQLRITAENASNGTWALSIGRITSARFPAGGPGVRVDTHLSGASPASPTIVSADFDSLLAKLIVTAPSWDAAVRRAARALDDTRVAGPGVATNLDVLRALVAHPDFAAGACDTRWLEARQGELARAGADMATAAGRGAAADSASSGGGAGAGAAAGVSNSTLLFRKGDAWSLTLAPLPGGGSGGTGGRSAAAAAAAPTHHLELTRVLRNDFPASLSAEILFSSSTAGASSSSPSSSGSAKNPGPGPSAASMPYVLHLAATTASSSAALSHHRRGSPNDPTHVCIPFAGKLVEVLVDEGDAVQEGAVLCVVQQMKMELEVRSAREGRVAWVFEADEGDDVAEGTLVCVLDLEGHDKEKARL